MIPIAPPDFEILLVEDNDFDAKRVSRALSRIDKPYTLHRAVDGRDALEKLRNSKRAMPSRSGGKNNVGPRGLPGVAHEPIPPIAQTPQIGEGQSIQSPYVILLDLNMPVMGGLPFLEELRRDPQLAKSPVVVMTTSEFYKDVDAAHGFNVNGYVVKPMSSGEMADVLRHVIEYFECCVLPK